MRTALALVVALGVALPLAGADSIVTVDASDTNYTPPVTTIASGDSVSWRSTDNTHITIDTRPMGGDPCMYAISPGHDVSTPVRFDVVGGALLATSEFGTLPCVGAIVTPAAAVMAYQCELHPLMRGTLVVTA